MIDRPFPPPNEAAVFEAGYLAGTLRARREFTWAQRAAIVGVLTSAAPDPRAAAPETPQPKLRSFALILARCESAATLLGWRKEIAPAQKRHLDAAIHRLQEAAAQVVVRAPVRPSAPKPDKFVRFFRIPGR
jgi:sugar/nucleoside kinase (ribokinase family)